jgi:uncharacterized protein YkuJ
MHLALIPPFSMLETATSQKYQLLLPHNFRNHGYAMWARDILDDDEQFTILDNGLAEGKQMDDIALIAMAAWYEPSELIVPDVLGERRASVDWARRFILLVQEESDDHPYTGSFAFVAQGKDWIEAIECVKQYVDDPLLHPYVNTIMIPRHLVTAQQPHARFLVAETLDKWLNTPDVDIHFLGGSKYFPSELKYAARDYPYVRGMDTSMPYVFGMSGAFVDTTESGGPEHRNDDEDYWTHEFSHRQERTALYNIEVMRKWAAGEY